MNRAGAQKTIYSIPKMDCAAEELLVRSALSEGCQVVNLRTDLLHRQLTVIHTGNEDAITASLSALNLGARLLDTKPATELDALQATRGADEARTLKIVLAINAVMFVGEAVGALIAQSSALLADSLDMFADAAVYGIALFGVHRARASQVRAAHVSGGLQLLLAFFALSEAVRRGVVGSEPEARLMVIVALAALVANLTSMWLLARHRQGGAHMKAGWIFTTNDVIANVAVIVAAIFVRVSGTNVPDLAVAVVIALVVLSGAIRILRMR